MLVSAGSPEGFWLFVCMAVGAAVRSLCGGPALRRLLCGLAGLNMPPNRPGCAAAVAVQFGPGGECMNAAQLSHWFSVLSWLK